MGWALLAGPIRSRRIIHHANPATGVVHQIRGVVASPLPSCTTGVSELRYLESELGDLAVKGFWCFKNGRCRGQQCTTNSIQ